jgi:hypothetical protein
MPSDSSLAANWSSVTRTGVDTLGAAPATAVATSAHTSAAANSNLLTSFPLSSEPEQSDPTPNRRSCPQRLHHANVVHRGVAGCGTGERASARKLLREDVRELAQSRPSSDAQAAGRCALPSGHVRRGGSLGSPQEASALGFLAHCSQFLAVELRQGPAGVVARDCCEFVVLMCPVNPEGVCRLGRSCRQLAQRRRTAERSGESPAPPLLPPDDVSSRRGLADVPWPQAGLFHQTSASASAALDLKDVHPPAPPERMTCCESCQTASWARIATAAAVAAPALARRPVSDA